MADFIKGIGSAAQGFAVGSSEVKKMYLGETKIYQNFPYQRIEYIQTTGTQYINTGITTNSSNYKTVGVDVEVINGSISSDNAIFGNNGQGYMELYFTSSMVSYWNGNRSVSISTTTSNKTFVISARMNASSISITANGTTKTTTSSNGDFQNRELSIFRHNFRYPYRGKLKWMKIYLGGVMVRDYVPVRVGSVGYLYDIVSKQLFSNAGSGSFTLGPDV